MSEKMLLILDIDETLVFATEGEIDHSSDFHFSKFSVRKRPFLDEFLQYCFAKFSVAIWTSSTKDYVVEVVDNILDTGQELEFLWARERCTLKFFPEDGEFRYLKNLHKIKRKGYDLTQTIMVDNTPHKLIRNYGNLVWIDDFVGDQNDRELKRLQNYLDDLAQVPNVRNVEKRGWQSLYPL